MMDDSPQSLAARTGILKHGKFWKNGDSSKKIEVCEADEAQRRSVRFSGRDEYTMVDSATLEEHAALARLIQPKLRELGMLLGKDPWQLDLGSVAGEQRMIDIPDPPPEPKSQPLDPSQLENEHIEESMRRYEEMRRRLAAGEPRDGNSESSDESKSSNDSHSSDSITTESRIRRLENSDVAQVAGGILRSNNEVRRAIEQNALRRSLMKFSDARKKDTNKNDRSEKQESSILEKLKWLTASEDLTNGNSDDKIEENVEEQNETQQSAPEVGVSHVNDVEPSHSKMVGTVTQYRHLAEMFNKSTSARGAEVSVPGDVREWKLETDLFPAGFIILDGNGDMPEAGATYTAVPAVSVCDVEGGEEPDKLLYSGGVRYTREGTLMPPRRKELYVNKILGKTGRYTLDDIDEALHDDHSSSVPSSSQSSPRLSGRSDIDGTSNTESGYSSNETNGDYHSCDSIDELAEFVRKDATRLERLRMRYNEHDDQDHGFGRRPAVKGIKPRSSSSNELLQHVTNQATSGQIVSSNVSNEHTTWLYREPNPETTATIQRQRIIAIRSVTLPCVQEDPHYPSADHCIEQVSCTQEGCCHGDHTFTVSTLNSGQNNASSVQVNTIQQHDAYCQRQVRAIENDQRSSSRYSNQHDIHDISNSQHIRMANSQTVIRPNPHYGSTQSLQSGVCRPHHPSCLARRPNSLHETIPNEGQISKISRPTNLSSRPHSSLGQYTGSRYPDEALASVGNQHQPLAGRGSFPGTSAAIHSISSPTQHTESSGGCTHAGVKYQQAPLCMIQNKSNYPHSPPEIVSPNNGSPDGSGGISLMGCYPRPHQQQQRVPITHDRCYPPQWHPISGAFVPVPSHLSYTTPIVPENGSGQSIKVHPEVMSKMDLNRDERGVPEGASSSPRSSYDTQYHTHVSPTREQTLLLRHAPALDISS